MFSTTLNRAARSQRARRMIEGTSATRRVVDRFVAGQYVPDAVRAAATIRVDGRQVTIDVLSEDVHDLAGARATRDAYMSLLWALHEADCAASADVSVKLSALGQSFPDRGEDIALTHAREICVAASAVGGTVTLDMEDHTTVDSTLAIGDQLRNDFPFIGNVLQSCLLRTRGDIAALARSQARIRLVKGAYREPATVAHRRKAAVDDAYCADLDALMASSCYPMVATHDPRMLAHAASSAALSGRSATHWEVQMLYGIRTDLQAAAIAKGQQVRVYIPFGTDWYGYFLRRLAERPANVGFFLRALARR